jgi:hypothetical protein
MATSGAAKLVRRRRSTSWFQAALTAANQDEKTAEVGTQLDQARQRITVLTNSLQRNSKTFIQDIVSDEYGVSLHRFQVVVWTITLGFVFFIGVWNDKMMPDFSPTLLALMGISGGTYLAFKIPEARK